LCLATSSVVYAYAFRGENRDTVRRKTDIRKYFIFLFLHLKY